MERTMRFGISLPPFADFGDARTLGELAREAEAAGRIMARRAVQLRWDALSAPGDDIPPAPGPIAAHPDLGGRELAEQAAPAPRRPLGRCLSDRRGGAHDPGGLARAPRIHRA